MRFLTILGLLISMFSCTSDKAVSVAEDSNRWGETSQLSPVDKDNIKRVVLAVYALDYRFQEKDLDVAEFLSPELLKLCVLVKATEQQSAELTPTGEKPAIVEGEIFASLYEGYQDVKIIDLKKDGESCIATVEFSHAYDASSPKEIWQDHLVLTLYKGEWKLDNVLYREGRNYPKDLKTYLRNFYTQHYISEE